MQRELEAKLILLEKLHVKGLLAFSQGQPLSSPLQKQPFKPVKKNNTFVLMVSKSRKQ